MIIFAIKYYSGIRMDEYMYEFEIKQILSQHLCLKEIYVFSNQNHYQIIVVDQIFSEKSKLDQHKIIYALITKYILEKKIHSVSIHSFKPQEWKIYGKNHINNK